MPSFIYDLYWVLVFVISFIVGMIVLFGLSVVFYRTTRNRYYSRRDRLRLVFAPLVASLEPHQAVPGLLEQMPGSLSWSVIEELLIKAIKANEGDRKLFLIRMIERFGYVRWYLTKLKRGNRWEQAFAAEKLGHMEHKLAVPSLIEALQNPVADVQTVAVRSLAKIGGNEAAYQLARKLIEVAHTEQDVSLRILKHALISLGPQVVPPLHEGLHHFSWKVRSACIDTLGEISDARSIPDLRKALNDPEQDVRAKAAHALGRMKNLESAELLIGLLKDKVWIVRLQAIRSLGILLDPKSVTPLLHRMADEHWRVRAAAAESLSLFGDKTIEPVLMVITHSTDRYALEQFMEELQRSHLLESYIEMLAGSSRRTRQSAISIISQFIRHDTTGLLIHHLKNNPNPTIRQSLVELFGQSNSPKILSSLQWTSQNDADPRIRQAASEICVGLMKEEDCLRESGRGSNQ